MRPRTHARKQRGQSAGARRGDGATAFDAGVGAVSGAWVTGRPSSPVPGLLLYVMVDSVATTLEAVVAPGADEQATISRIQAERRVGRGLREIARRLDSAGIPCRGGRWSHTTVRSVLLRSAQLIAPTRT